MPEYLVTGNVEQSVTTKIVARDPEHAKQIFQSIQFARGLIPVGPQNVKLAP